jgi:hypothetical protein
MKGVFLSHILCFWSCNVTVRLELLGGQKSTFHSFYVLLQKSCKLCAKSRKFIILENIVKPGIYIP